MRSKFDPHLLGSLAAFTFAVVGCANNPQRLPELDRRFYYNLETAQEQKQFLKLSDDRQRRDFLDRKGLWSQWLSLSDEERSKAGKGSVEVGFKEFAVFMAWGPPADTQTRDRHGRPVRVHTFIRCSSGPKFGQYVRAVMDCDGTSEETQVAIRGDIVSEILYPH